MVTDNKWHLVVKANSDGSVLVGDIVGFDESGRLWKKKSVDGSQAGWIDKEDLSPKILDFEVEDC